MCDKTFNTLQALYSAEKWTYVPFNIFTNVVDYFEDLQFIQVKSKEHLTAHLYCKAHEYLPRSKELFKILYNEYMVWILVILRYDNATETWL